MKTPISIRRGTVAAVFIDLQEEHRRDKRYLVEGFADILANAQRLQEAARRNFVPLHHWAYIVDLAKARPFHPVDESGKSAFSDKDDPLTAICHEVAPQNGEAMLVKQEASAFGKNDFAQKLKASGIEWLVIAGVWTEACIDATVKDAVALGFRVLLVKDACGSASAAMHQTGILNLANRLYGGAVVTTDAACRLMAGEAAEGWTPQSPVPIRYEAETIGELYEAL
jgi:nicotinamidase-related amidase